MKNNAIALAVVAAFACGAAIAQDAPYQVDGNKVDEATYNGWKIYKRERCETCHGPTAEGGAAFPNLLESLKKRSKEEFVQVVLEGRNAMPPHKARAKVVEHMDGLYAYLKGRSDGAIPAGDLEKLP